MRFVFLLLIWTIYKSEECGKLKTNDSPPWNVGIYMENEANKQLELICFGSVIKSNAILTAAHCFCENLSGGIRNSNFFITTEKLEKVIPFLDDGKLQKIHKKQILVNEEYNGLIGSLSGDIAVVKLDKKIDLDQIEPVCVDWSNSDPFLNDGQMGKLPVWDKTHVKIIDLPHLDFDFCKAVVSKSFRVFVTNDKICTMSSDIVKNEVSADLGAGLIFQSPHDHLWYIKGVISSHDLEATGAITSVSVNVNRNINWLSNVCAKFKE